MLNHVNALHNDHRREHLRRGDDDDSIKWQRLHDGHRCVRCAWWEIDQQKVETTPIDIAIELFDSAGDHWAAPDNRVALFLQEHVHRHDLDATLAAQRVDAAASRLAWLSLRAKHTRYAGAGDIAVQDANLLALSAQGDGQQTCDERFADAAFSAHNRNDLLDLAIGCTARHR